MVFCDIKKAEEFASCPGDPLRPIYKPVVSDDGSVSLAISGYENTDEQIQSFAESCDIRTIINRANNGDLTALNVRNGMYGDFTQMPKTYAEMLQLQIDAKIVFDKLDAETKKKFNNDVNQFLATAGEDEWIEKLTPVQPDEKEVKEGIAE